MSKVAKQAADPSLLRWYAVHTRSRHEKLVASQLAAAHIESFLPLRGEHRQWADRRKWVEFPMFPGYLFARCDADALEAVWTAKGVARVLGDGRGKPTPVPDWQIEGVRALAESGLQVEEWDYLEEGSQVRVLCGPLMGLTGIFVQRKVLGRIVIRVDMIGKAVAAEMDAEDVEAV